MAEVTRVIDYMSGLPSAAEHAKTYATEYAEREAKGTMKIIDGAGEEKKTISDGEKAIIGRLNCNAKFTKNGLVDGFKISAGVSLGLNGRVRRENTYELNFRGTDEWFLLPAESRALYSKKESTVHVMDEEQRSRILARCPTLAGSEANGVMMMGVHERLSIPQDLRHIMMKMYLILCDYNLATVSKCTTFDVAEGLSFATTSHISGPGRLSAIVAHDIVVDADAFTPQELGLLGLAGEAYPSVWYAGDNIYTKCYMEPDDVVIISSGGINLDMSLAWGSPDRLYQMIWSVAAKLDAIPSWLSVIESMRGKCQMVANMLPHLEGNIINSMVPKSFCQTCAVSGMDVRAAVTNMPGYLSTSAALIADLVYGNTFEAVASCAIEALGGLGNLVSSATPRTNLVINGILRDYGLQHTSSEDNILLKNWELMVGRPITWEFGVHLKDYLLGLATNINNGADIIMPQVLMTVPHLTAINTSYGLTRGWRGPKNLLESDKVEVARQSDQLCAVAWMAGVRNARPKVFFNRMGKRPNNLGPAEGRLSAEGEGDLRLGDVQFWMQESLGGRIDENEYIATDYYRTEYAGVRDILIYHYSEEAWAAQRNDPASDVRVTYHGLPPVGEVAPPTRTTEVPQQPSTEGAGGNNFAGVHWGPLKKNDNRATMEHLRALSRQNAIAPGKQARYTKMGMDGKPKVQPYWLEGQEENDAIVDSQRHVVSVGDKLRVRPANNPVGDTSAVGAVGEDLKISGLLAPVDANRLQSLFSDKMFDGKLVGVEDALALAKHWGMGADVYMNDGTVMQMAGSDGAHKVTLIGGENGHVTAGVVVPGGTYDVRDIREVKHDAVNLSHVTEFGRLFAEVQ